MLRSMAALLSERNAVSSCSLHGMQLVFVKVEDETVPSGFVNPQGIIKQMVE